jgi:hypothetical protein
MTVLLENAVRFQAPRKRYIIVNNRIELKVPVKEVREKVNAANCQQCSVALSNAANCQQSSVALSHAASCQQCSVAL